MSGSKESFPSPVDFICQPIDIKKIKLQPPELYHSHTQTVDLQAIKFEFRDFETDDTQNPPDFNDRATPAQPNIPPEDVTADKQEQEYVELKNEFKTRNTVLNTEQLSQLGDMSHIQQSVLSMAQNMTPCQTADKEQEIQNEENEVMQLEKDSESDTNLSENECDPIPNKKFKKGRRGYKRTRKIIPVQPAPIARVSDAQRKLILDGSAESSRGQTGPRSIITGIEVVQTPGGSLRVNHDKQIVLEKTPGGRVKTWGAAPTNPLEFWDEDDFVFDDTPKANKANTLIEGSHCRTPEHHQPSTSSVAATDATLLRSPSYAPPISGLTRSLAPHPMLPYSLTPSSFCTITPRSQSPILTSPAPALPESPRPSLISSSSPKAPPFSPIAPRMQSPVSTLPELIQGDSGSEIDDDPIEDNPIEDNPIEDNDLVSEDDDESGEDDNCFLWSDDFENFIGQPEQFLGNYGPTIDSTDPYEILTFIWDRQIIGDIVKQTNLYAWQCVMANLDGNTLPSRSRIGKWVDVVDNDIYVYLSLLMHFSFIHASRISDYWMKGTVLEMPLLSRVMSRDKFLRISRYLHFVDNNNIAVRGPDRKLAKIRPILDHCNEKFAQLYTPGRFISIDESLLLYKGYLSFVQFIRTKAARFGIKSFELCESLTGYLYRFVIYVGKNTSDPPDAGFVKSGQIVLDLLKGLFHKGYCVVLDNYYTGVGLARYLKKKGVDVIGTLRRNRQNVPDDIKQLKEKGRGAMVSGSVVSQHCGDLSVTTWKDTRLVTMLSTFHRPQMTMSSKAGRPLLKPQVVLDYNKTMGGVDLKDQQLAMYPIERKRGQRWYMKLFKRLFNSSILNSYIVYRYNKVKLGEKPLSHRDFRYALAKSLLDKHLETTLPLPEPAVNESVRFDNRVRHDPYEYQDRNTTNRIMRHRCKYCAIDGKRKLTRYHCKTCNVPLCIGICWTKYHTFSDI